MRMLSGIVGNSRPGVKEVVPAFGWPHTERHMINQKSQIENGGKSLLTLLRRAVHNSSRPGRASLRVPDGDRRRRPERSPGRVAPPVKAGLAGASTK